MSNYYTEANYENSAIELFRNNLDYDYIYAPDNERRGKGKADETEYVQGGVKRKRGIR